MDKATDPITRLRSLLKEGPYIQEEALECLTEIEFLYETICSQSEVQAHDVENLSQECEKFKTGFYQSTPHEIDFGTGKLYYRLENGSSAYLVELMIALKDAAMVVPLQALVKRVQSDHGFKRF
jgi:hypothetical protein